MKICDREQARKGFRKYFNIGINDIYDCMMSAFTGFIWIDIIRFENLLIKEHGKVPDGISLEEYVIQYYGTEANEFFKQFI